LLYLRSICALEALENLRALGPLPNGPFAIEEGSSIPKTTPGRPRQTINEAWNFFLFPLSKLLKRIPTGVKACEFKKDRITMVLHSRPAVGVPRHDVRGLAAWLMAVRFQVEKGARAQSA